VRRAPRRTVIPATVAVVVAAVLVGVAIASIQLSPTKPVSNTDTVAVDDRAAADRAGRGELREAPSPSASASPSPSASPSASPSPTPTKSKTPSKAPTTPAGVASTGTCKASFYGDELAGSRTANGETFNPDGLTAAHKSLPFNTMVRVTNQANGKSVVVRINDRGPYVSGRCLDLAEGAFIKVASKSAGVINARYEVLK
jgi:rare lipoprotein A